jgi:hypothetical protein
MARTVPLSYRMDGQFSALRHWAKGRAREAANNAKRLPHNDRRIAGAN